MAEMDFGRGGGAHCALHPDLAAAGTCARCGNFMCGTCSQGGTQALCPTCRAREQVGQAFPLDRGNWTVSALLDTCWAAFQREWVMICVGLLLVFAASIVGQIFAQVFSFAGGLTDSAAVTIVFALLGFLVSTVIQGLVVTGFMRMLLDVLDGQRANLERLFSQFHKAVPYVLTLLLMFALAVPVLLLFLGAVGVTALVTGVFAASDLSLQGLESMQPEDVSRIFAAAGSALFATIGVAVVLYIILLVWLGLPLMLFQLELAANDAPRPLDVLRRCFAYARGERLAMLGVSLLGGLVMVVGFIACCVGAFPAAGFFYLLLAGLYLSLRNGAEVD